MTSRSKILYVCEELPYPPISGVRIPAWYFMKGLAQEYQVIPIIYAPGTPLEMETCKKAFIENKMEVSFFYGNARTRSKVEKFLDFISTTNPSFVPRKCDVEFSQFISNKIQEFEPALVFFDPITMGLFHKAVPDGLPKIIAPHDSFAYAMKCEVEVAPTAIHRAYGKVQLNRAMRLERTLYPSFNYCHLVSRMDAKFLEEINANIKTVIVSNGVDTEYFKTRRGVCA